MTKTNQNLFATYFEYLTNSGYSNLEKGRRSSIVHVMLESIDRPSVRAITKYRRSNATELARRRADEAIDEFLIFLGLKDGKLKKSRANAEAKGDVLKSLDILTEENKRDLDGFVVYLREETDLSDNAIRCYLDGIKKFFRYSHEVNTISARNFLATLEHEGMKPQTINLRATALVRFAEWKGIKLNIKRPKVRRTLHCNNIPSKKDYSRLLEYLKGLPDKNFYLWVWILATTGLRIHEFLGLRWHHVLAGDTVLKGKGSKFRQVFFPKSLVLAAKAYVEDKRISPEAPVVINKYGEPMSSRGFAQQLIHHGTKVGIDRPKLHPHAFRHFFAKQYLVANKNDIASLGDLLGHANLDTTRIYIQKSYDEQKHDYNRTVTW